MFVELENAVQDVNTLDAVHKNGLKEIIFSVYYPRRKDDCREQVSALRANRGHFGPEAHRGISLD